MSKGIRISEAAYLELRRRAESEKRTLQAVVDLLVEQTMGPPRAVASRAMDAWIDDVRGKGAAKDATQVVSVEELRGALLDKLKKETAAKAEHSALSIEHSAEGMPQVFKTESPMLTLARKHEALSRREQAAAQRATAAKVAATQAGRALERAIDEELGGMAASSEHGAPAAGRTDTSAAGCASTGVPPAGEPRSGGGEAAGTPGSPTTAAPPMEFVLDQTLCLCGHIKAVHSGGPGHCGVCACQSFVDLEQDLF